MMKKSTWEWFQRNIEDKVYSENPPSWGEFKQAVMDELMERVVSKACIF